MYSRRQIYMRDVPGLYLYPDVFTKDEENSIITDINDDRNKNVCTQIHIATEYGWKFLPITTKTENDYLGELPNWLQNIWKNFILKLEKIDELVGKCDIPDHVLVNFYPVSDGCNPHVDDIKFWNNWVVGVSLGSGCNIVFSSKTCEKTYWIPPRSVYVITSDARYLWKHEIKFEEKDIFYGDIIQRDSRFSITFRTIHSDILSQSVRESVKKNENIKL